MYVYRFNLVYFVKKPIPVIVKQITVVNNLTDLNNPYSLSIKLGYIKRFLANSGKHLHKFSS